MGANCDTQNKDLASSSLKAIGNIGYFNDVNVLLNCARNKDASSEVRSNAVQSLRKFECDQIGNEMLSLFKELDDTELRLNSFLVLVNKCPEQIENNAHVFDAETNHQVILDLCLLSLIQLFLINSI